MTRQSRRRRSRDRDPAAAPRSRDERRLRGASLAVLVAVYALASAACGYTLVGRGAFIPDYIRTVAIPTFENSTDRFEVEVRISDAVVREFVSRGNYRVVASPDGADAVLRGEILSFNARPVGFGAQRAEASTFLVEIRASVTFTDLVANQVLFANRSFVFSGEFEFPEDPNALFDVEIGSIDEIAGEFARSVVSSILEAF